MAAIEQHCASKLNDFMEIVKTSPTADAANALFMETVNEAVGECLKDAPVDPDKEKNARRSVAF